MKIKSVETFDGCYKLKLYSSNGDRIILYIDTNSNKIKGMWKSIDNDYIDIPEQDIPESEEEWRY